MDGKLYGMSFENGAATNGQPSNGVMTANFIRVIVPAGASSGRISVTNAGGYSHQRESVHGAISQTADFWGCFK
jgi:hypothetical protein